MLPCEPGSLSPTWEPPLLLIPACRGDLGLNLLSEQNGGQSLTMSMTWFTRLHSASLLKACRWLDNCYSQLSAHKHIMAKEKEGLDDVSFWTTPADDGFRFSNLSSDHVSKLAESGPFVAVVLCYWDNVLGPRLQHVWRGVGDAEFQVNDLSNHRQSRLAIEIFEAKL